MRPKTNAQIQEAIVLRDSGYSLTAISERTHISPSTLQRAFTKHGISKRGSLSASSVMLARDQLLKDGSFMDNLKVEVAAALLDDLSQFKQLRAAVSIAVEALMIDPNTTPSFQLRGLAAAAVVVKTTQETIRKTLGVDSIPPPESELPSITVTCMTAQDFEQVHATRLGSED